MKKSKMNLSLVLIVSAVAGATFFFSCSKDAKEMNPSSPVSPTLTMNAAPYTACPNVANTENPFDNAGVFHNKGLDFVAAHQPSWPCDPASMTQMGINLTVTFSNDNGYNCNAGDISNALNVYQSSSIEDIIRSNVSPAAQGYTRELFDDISSYSTDSTQIDSLLAAIKRIEHEVNTSTLNPDDKKSFLETASIARYSACYWFQENQKSASFWGHCPTNPIPAGKYNWTKLLCVICADAAGYIVANLPGGLGLSTIVASI